MLTESYWYHFTPEIYISPVFLSFALKLIWLVNNDITSGNEMIWVILSHENNRQRFSILQTYFQFSDDHIDCREEPANFTDEWRHLLKTTASTLLFLLSNIRKRKMLQPS